MVSVSMYVGDQMFDVALLESGWGVANEFKNLKI